MRYDSDRKKQTHDRIVAGATKLFRENGYAASGVDTVMAAAGLTAGGFYAHFKNKDALLAEAVEDCKVKLTDGEADDSLESWVNRYLSTTHRDHPGEGCPLPPLAGEIARQPKKVRTAFTRALRQRLDRLTERVPGNNEDRAIEMLAGAVGAMLIARAVDDVEFSDRILRVMRESMLKSECDAKTRRAPRQTRTRAGK